jgi:hypothetical protein
MGTIMAFRSLRQRDAVVVVEVGVILARSLQGPYRYSNLSPMLRPKTARRRGQFSAPQAGLDEESAGPVADGVDSTDRAGCANVAIKGKTGAEIEKMNNGGGSFR